MQNSKRNYKPKGRQWVMRSSDGLYPNHAEMDILASRIALTSDINKTYKWDDNDLNPMKIKMAEAMTGVKLYRFYIKK